VGATGATMAQEAETPYSWGDMRDSDHQEPVLSLKGLSVAFGVGAEPVTREISFGVFRGQTLAIVGESGSGKSVTAMAVPRLMREAKLVSGEIRFEGRRIDDIEEGELRRLRGRHIGFIFQEPMTSLNPVMKVGEQIAEAYEIHHPGESEKARSLALDWMRRVGIENPEAGFHAYPHQFSGGMRQRVMIAMALICSPGLLIADEPTTALDVTVQSKVMELIGRLRDEMKMAVLLVTHDMGLVSQHADAVCVMYRGRVVEFGPAHQVIRRPIHPYTRGLLLSAPRPDRKQDRLHTVADVMSDPQSGTLTREVSGGCDPYVDDSGRSSAYRLLKVDTCRWVAVRSSEPTNLEVPCVPPESMLATPMSR
jgi:ABC-type dipeptide/oligopeptide/nickel transport system ATPase component